VRQLDLKESEKKKGLDFSRRRDIERHHINPS